MLKNKTHLPCPCGKSSDAYSVNEKGWGKCFSCDKKFPPANSDEVVDLGKAHDIEKRSKEFRPLTTVFRDFKSRNLSSETIARYKVDVDPDGIRARYPVFQGSNHVGNKIRGHEKEFSYEGTGRDLDLFGMHAFEPGCAKTITVTEGQDDAMAVFELTGRRYPAVSVHSSSTAEADVRRNFEYLNSFEQIVICFDTDEPGRMAAAKVASIGFPLGKLRVLQLRSAKDANDYLKAQKREQFTKEWWDAPVYKPDGILLGSDEGMFEKIVNRKSLFTVQYPFESLNKMTYGMRLSEAVIVTADTGVGKTSFLKECEYKLLMDEELKEKNYGVGFLHFEEPNEDTLLGLMSIHNSKPYHLPDVERSNEELRDAYDACINTSRVVIWDHFGSNSVDAVLDKVRHMHALGCHYIVIDHLSIIVSDQSGDERKQLDEISTKLKTMCMELNIALMCVIHTNRQGQIRGTAGVEQLANIVMKLERENKSPDSWRRNVTKITIEKNRFCGRSGPCAWLFYNEITGRLTELSPEEIQAYENNEKPRDDMVGW